MRIGVENFDPQRLSEALNFKMISMAALAKAANVAPASITLYINGSRKPSPEAFFAICKTLGFCTNFFLKSKDRRSTMSTLKQWRSLSTAQKSDRNKGEVLLQWISDIHTRFLNDFPLPTCDILSPSGLSTKYPDCRLISSEDIEQAALELRTLWGLGELPIRNLVRVAERAGFVIGKYNLNVSQLDAVSTVVDSTPYILLNSVKQSGCRSRFDLAHEIGHVVLHRGVSAEDFEDNSGKDFYKRVESQAHRFASAFLIPADRFRNDFWAPTIQCFIDMKAKWHISIQALIRRAYDLELITEKQYEYLQMAVNRKKIKAQEPLDDEIPIESLRLFPKCFEKYEEFFGHTKVLELVQELNLPKSVIEELCGLESKQLYKIEENHDSSQGNLIEVDFKSPNS